MPVREIKNGMPIEVNHVYVMRPRHNLFIRRRKTAKLNKLKDAGLKRMPVDWFFRSLAQEQGNRGYRRDSVSGTATDGTLGAEAIKAEGGITFVQDENLLNTTVCRKGRCHRMCGFCAFAPKDCP